VKADVQTRMRPALGTLCAIEATGAQGRVESGMAAAFEELLWIERLLHPHRIGSDVCAISNSGGQPVAVHAATWELLQRVKLLHELSEGVFDPCHPDTAGTFGDIQLPEPMTVVCRHKVRLDLGGVAKGYAVDRAVDVLKAAGCVAGMVNAGGDVRVFGDEPRAIHLRMTGCASRPVLLHDNALAVSDALAANHPAEFQGYYCRTSQRGMRHQQAAIIAPNAAMADALTKCALVCADENMTRLLDQFDAVLVR
jgi:FAD:protein FMN transferase